MEEDKKKAETPLLDFCPHCGKPTEQGFSLAGGGYGIYTFCADDACGLYFGKIQAEA